MDFVLGNEQGVRNDSWRSLSSLSVLRGTTGVLG